MARPLPHAKYVLAVLTKSNEADERYELRRLLQTREGKRAPPDERRGRAPLVLRVRPDTAAAVRAGRASSSTRAHGFSSRLGGATTLI